jgi:hypothetical protein
MTTLEIWHRRATISLLALTAFLFAGSARGAVILDFTSSNPTVPPSGTVPLPWNEDGFSVTVTPAGGADVELTPSPTGRPPYAGELVLTSSFGIPSIVSVNNSSGALFDLLGLNILPVSIFPFPFPGSGTNQAVLRSSAGGLLTLPNPTSPTTLTFSGALWQNLSWVQFQLASTTTGPRSFAEFRLDNISLQPHAIPEPSTFALAFLGGGILLRRRRR